MSEAGRLHARLDVPEGAGPRGLRLRGLGGLVRFDRLRGPMLQESENLAGKPMWGAALRWASSGQPVVQGARLLQGADPGLQAQLLGGVERMRRQGEGPARALSQSRVPAHARRQYVRGPPVGHGGLRQRVQRAHGLSDLRVDGVEQLLAHLRHRRADSVEDDRHAGVARREALLRVPLRDHGLRHRGLHGDGRRGLRARRLVRVDAMRPGRPAEPLARDSETTGRRWQGLHGPLGGDWRLRHPRCPGARGLQAWGLVAVAAVRPLLRRRTDLPHAHGWRRYAVHGHGPRCQHHRDVCLQHPGVLLGQGALPRQRVDRLGRLLDDLRHGPDESLPPDHRGGSGRWPGVQPPAPAHAELRHRARAVRGGGLRVGRVAGLDGLFEDVWWRRPAVTRPVHFPRCHRRRRRLRCDGRSRGCALRRAALSCRCLRRRRVG
mmetsp:Transcript_11410/g.40485  ORF Transcript_11410/g.40485 Transcript_11410/m.40485 type:complete len:435 (-) Transcript_11410:3838-5142(-)